MATMVANLIIYLVFYSLTERLIDWKLGRKYQGSLQMKNN